MAEKIAIFLVYRTAMNRKGTKPGGRHERFEVPFDHRTTVMDGLEYIRTKIDDTIMYRHSCHHGSCGTCAMLINGDARLACLTPVADFGSVPIEITPLQTLEGIGDLAVDPRKLFLDFPQNTTYIRTSETRSKALHPEELSGFHRLEDCIECGICVSACPVVSPFAGPAAIAAYSREIENRPERESELLPRLDNDSGVFACRRALKCSRDCPTGVNPARHIAELRRKIEKKKKAV